MESTSEQRFRKSNNSGIRQITDKQLLSDAGLVTDNGDVTYAALVLLGKPGSVKNFLGLTYVSIQERRQLGLPSWSVSQI